MAEKQVWTFFSIGWIWSQYNISGFHIPVSVVVETQEVVPKPCNLFFIGQLWVGPPASSLSSMFIPAGARSYHLLYQEHLSLPGCLQLPDHEHHLGKGRPFTETSDHSDMQVEHTSRHITIILSVFPPHDVCLYKYIYHIRKELHKLWWAANEDFFNFWGFLVSKALKRLRNEDCRKA